MPRLVWCAHHHLNLNIARNSWLNIIFNAKLQVLVYENPLLLGHGLGGGINLCLAKFPSFHLVLEKNVNFSKRPVLGLSHAKVRPDEAKRHDATVEETRLGTPVLGSVLYHEELAGRKLGCRHYIQLVQALHFWCADSLRESL